MFKALAIFLLVVSLSFASEKILKDLETAWNYYEKGQFYEMKKLSEKILKKSLEEKFPKGIVEGYYYLGIANFSLGNIPEALEYANKTIEFSKKYNRYRWKAYGHALAGEILRSLRKYDEALSHFKKAYKLAVSNNNKKMIPPALINIGNIYYDKRNLKKAVDYYKQALKYAEGINLRKSYIAFINYNIGITFYRMKNYKEAVKFLEKSISLYKEIGNKKSQIEAKFYTAKAYMKEGNKEKAKEIFTQIINETKKGFIHKRAKYFLKKLEKNKS